MKILSSYFFRLAVLIAVLPILVMGAALAVSYTSTATQLRHERIYQINDDLAALVEIHTDQGKAGLIHAIENRLQLTPETRARAHYALTDADGTKHAGDLKGAILGNQNYTTFIDWKKQTGAPLIVRTTPLRDGNILHVAREDGIRQKALAQLRKTFSLMALATLALSICAGIFASHIFKRRLKTVNETCEEVAQGHLGARIPNYKTQDEFGMLSHNVNSMLERIGKLISLRKNITDQVAHELRSPLTRLDASLVKAAKTAKNPKDIEAARIEITNCISLLDALLDVSSLEAQSGDRSGFDTVDLSELTAQMSEFYQGLAEEKNIALSTNITPDISFEGDSMQLSRLIANLVDNAIKYTPAGGKVRISLSQSPNSKTPILAVSDNGTGVPANIRASIFTPFFRDPGLKAGREQSVGGHGLGLALSQAIAKRHGMKIRVEGADSGARFILS